MARLSVTSGEAVSLPHRLLWSSSKQLLSIADERPDDTWVLHLSAGLLAAASFEAYINHLGQEILPLEWSQERKNFSNEPYKGLLGKVRRIAHELGYQLPPTTHKPFAGWLELQGLRDKIVHARTTKESFTRTHKTDELPTKLPAAWMSQELRPKKVRELISLLNAFAREIHFLVAASDVPEAAFGSQPMEGILSYAHGSVGEIA